MSLEFKYYKINDIGEVVSGGTPSTSKNEYWYGDIGWITPKDLSSYDDIYISRGERNISSEGLNNSSAKLVPKNTVLMTSRAPIGYIAIANNELSTNQGFKSLICNEKICHYKYFYYWLKLNIKYIINNSNGSTFKEISGGTFKNLELSLPSLNEQKAISSVLWTIDEKISVLKRINKNLEELMHVLFKKYFIDSNPFYVENDENWNIIKLKDLIIRNRDKINDFDNWKDELLIDLSNMPRFSIAISNFDKGKKFTSNIYKLNKYDLLFGSIRPYFGKVGFSPINGVVTGTVHSFKPIDDIYYSLVLSLISSKTFINYTVSVSKGTKMPSVKWDDFINYEFAIPDDLSKIGEYNKILLPLIHKIEKNILEIQRLTKLRDTLLPKLMSGEIDVSKINCDLKIIIRKIYIKSSKLFLWRYLSENKNYIKNTKSNETLLKSRTIYKINKFLAKFNARYRYYRQ